MTRLITPHPDCPKCKGTGICQECDGEGEVTVERYAPPHALEQNLADVECPKCDGDGECRECEQEAIDDERWRAKA